MTIGGFDKRATIQSRSGPTDAHGHVSPVWADMVTRWCRLEDQSGRELFRAQRVDPQVSAVVTLREKYPGLGPKDRVKVTISPTESRTFSIKTVLGSFDRTPKHGQVLACTEEV